MRVCDRRALRNIAARARACKRMLRPPCDPITWWDPRVEKYHRYRLHAFEEIEDPWHIMDWIACNTDELAESWEPYVTSRRAVHWIVWMYRRHGPELDEEFQRVVSASLYWQLKRLTVDVEYHIQANHLFENFKALCVGSQFLLRHGYPATRQLDRWWRRGVRGLLREIRAQILPDGGHYERSPMYHAIVMDGIRTVQEYGGDDVVRHRCDVVLEIMEAWLAHLSHPDGRIALFQDSVFRGTPRIAVIQRPQVAQGLMLDASGYFVYRWGNGCYFVMDCGEPSPAYQPAHAHCSALSYELSVGGQRVIVDSGCGSYQNPEVRAYCRRTASHNVPMIFGTEQSEVWGAFRMGRRVEVLARYYDAAGKMFECRIRDFRGNVLKRRVTFYDREIVIEDVLEKRVCEGVLQSLLHLHPTVNSAVVHSKNPSRVGRGVWYPEFGEGIPNATACFFGNPNDQILYRIAV